MKGRRSDPRLASFKAVIDEMLNNLRAPVDLREFTERALKKSGHLLDPEMRYKAELEGWMRHVRQFFKQRAMNGLPIMTYTHDGWVATGYMLKRQWKSAICKFSAGVRADARMLAIYVKEYERKYKEKVPIRKIGVAYPTDWAEFNSDDTE